MAKQNNFLLFVGIGIILLSIFYFGFGNDGDKGSFFGKSYKIECSVTVDNNIFGSEIKSSSCEKTTKAFCGSPLSIISSDFKLRLKAGESSKSESFSLSNLGIDKIIDISVCTKEDVNSVILELIQDNEVKSTDEVSV